MSQSLKFLIYFILKLTDYGFQGAQCANKLFKYLLHGKIPDHLFDCIPFNPSTMQGTKHRAGQLEG